MDSWRMYEINMIHNKFVLGGDLVRRNCVRLLYPQYCLSLRRQPSASDLNCTTEPRCQFTHSIEGRVKLQGAPDKPPKTDRCKQQT